MHQVYAYMQRVDIYTVDLSFSKTSAIRVGVMEISFWATSWLMVTLSCLISAWSLSQCVGFCLSTHFFGGLITSSQWDLGSFLAIDPQFESFNPWATPFRLQTLLFPDVPNSLQGTSLSKITLPQSFLQSKLCTVGNPSPLGHDPAACWTFFSTLQLSSQRLKFLLKFLTIW